MDKKEEKEIKKEDKKEEKPKEVEGVETEEGELNETDDVVEYVEKLIELTNSYMDEYSIDVYQAMYGLEFVRDKVKENVTESNEQPEQATK